MKILGLETSGQSGSVAALENDRLLGQICLEPHERSAQALAPAIRRLCGEIGWAIRDMELIGVTVGPGSFTGLRVGLTTAKTLAYATGAAVLGVNTLAAIAWQAPEEVQVLEAAVDAQRQEAFVARFERASGDLRMTTEPSIRLQDEWLATAESDVWLSGPVLTKLAGRIPSNARVVPDDRWMPMAASVAQLARRDYEAGRRDDLWTLVPLYLRRSAAEEKLDEKPTG